MATRDELRSSNLQEAAEDLVTDALGFAQIWVETGFEIGRAALDAVAEALSATGAALGRAGEALEGEVGVAQEAEPHRAGEGDAHRPQA